MKLIIIESPFAADTEEEIQELRSELEELCRRVEDVSLSTLMRDTAKQIRDIVDTMLSRKCQKQATFEGIREILNDMASSGDFANSPHMQSFAEYISKVCKSFVEGGCNAYDGYQDHVKRRLEENIAELCQRAEDPSISKAECCAVAAELVKAYQRKAKFEDSFDRYLLQNLDLLSSAMQGEIDEKRAQTAHSEEAQERIEEQNSNNE